MKSNKTFLISFFLLIALIAFSSAESLGKIMVLSGKASKADGLKTEFLRIDGEQPFQQGNVVRTDSDSQILIIYRDMAKMLVKENTLIELYANHVKMTRGSVSYRFEKLKQEFKIKLPTATMGIIGTQLDVNFGKDGSVAVQVNEGIVRITVNRVDFYLYAGDHADITPDGKLKLKRGDKNPAKGETTIFKNLVPARSNLQVGIEQVDHDPTAPASGNSGPSGGKEVPISLGSQSGKAVSGKSGLYAWIDRINVSPLGGNSYKLEVFPRYSAVNLFARQVFSRVKVKNKEVSDLEGFDLLSGADLKRPSLSFSISATPPEDVVVKISAETAAGKKPYYTASGEQAVHIGEVKPVSTNVPHPGNNTGPGGTVSIGGLTGGSGNTENDNVWKTGPSLPKREGPGREAVPGFTAGSCMYVLEDGSKTIFRARQKAQGELEPWEKLPDAGYSTHWGYPVNVVPRAGGMSQVFLGPNWGYLKRTTADHSTGDLAEWHGSRNIGEDTGGERPVVWSAGCTVTVENNIYLYSIGGFEYAGKNFTNPQPLRDVFRTRITDDGNIEKWVKDTYIPDTPMQGKAVAVQAGGRNLIYLLGGSKDCTDRRWCLSRILQAEVGRDGKLGKWTTAGELPYEALGIIAFVRRGYLWIIGGSSDDWKVRNEIHRCPIGPDGSLGKWEAMGSLPGPAAETPNGFIGDYYYIVGITKGGKTPVYFSYFAP